MDTEQLPYYWQLEIISGILHKAVPDFPNRGCKLASKLVKDIAKLEQIVGTVVLDEEFKPETHYWNYDGQRGLYVDLSLHQYNGRLVEPAEAITIVSANYPWLRRTDITPEEADVRALVADVKEAIQHNGSKR
jgi:hypothetical protein